MSALAAEAAGLLSQLIRARSCNPPGNEDAPARVLGAYLRQAGIDVTEYQAAPGRSNLVARVRGSGGGRSLLLLSHLDTADADPEEWSSDPWSGAVRDGSVWGRGALDLKGQAAAQAVAVASALRNGTTFCGDVVLAATADEERGSRYGTRWLLDTHPEVLGTDYALTHGAGDRMLVDGRAVYFCAISERMAGGLTVTLTAPAGLPMLSGPNVITQAGRFVTQAAGQHVGQSLLEEVAEVIGSLAGTTPPPSQVAALASAIHPALGALLVPLTGATLAPSAIRSSSTAGRPSVCEIDFDCWLLPGQDPADVQQALDRAAGGIAHEVAWKPARGGSRSPTSTALWRAIEGYVQDIDPGSLLLPLCDAGFTDSHWLRERYGTVAYGFFPMLEMTTLEAARGVHGPDERMPLRDLALQIGFYQRVMAAVCGDGNPKGASPRLALPR